MAVKNQFAAFLRQFPIFREIYQIRQILLTIEENVSAIRTIQAESYIDREFTYNSRYLDRLRLPGYAA